MTLNSSRHRKRSIALTMLFVWVFALLSGVANACLTEPRGEVGYAGLRAALPDHEALAASHAHAGDAAGQTQHDHHPDKAPCQKSCDESSQTLLKQVPKLDTPDLQSFALPSPAWTVDLLQAPVVPGRAYVAAVPPPSPPPRVQFSRLAL